MRRPIGVIFLLSAVSVGLSGFTIIYDNQDKTQNSEFLLNYFAIQNVWAHDGDGDGIDDDTLLPVVDEASSDPFPGSGEDFSSTLTAGAVVGHTSNSTSSATATLLWSEDQERLQYEIQFSGPITLNTTAGSASQEAVTKIHIHIAESGSNGPHALNIFGGPAEDDAEMEVHLDDEEVHGVWGDIDTGTLTSDTARSKQLSDMREELCDEDLYFQVHTNWNGPGALRGQIEKSSELCEFDLAADEFTASLTREKVIAAGGTSSQTGTATAEFNLNATHGSLYYRIQFTNIDLGSNTTDTSDDLTKLHIHQGDAEENHGDHALNIFGLPSEDDAQMDSDPNNLVITGVWDDTDAVLSGTDAGRSHKLSDMIGKLCSDELYLQAHTNGGNIRGQIELQNHDLCDFDPNHDDFTATLDESQIVGGTGSTATGTAHLRFNSHSDELQYEIHLVGLDTDDIQTIAHANGTLITDDDLTAIHLHNAPSGKNGPVHLLNIFGTPAFDDGDFVNTPGNGTISGIWGDDDESFSPSENGRSKKLSNSIDALCNSEVYINVHTQNHTGGEIRGQIIPTSDNIMCEFDLTEHDFVSTMTECKIDLANGDVHECEEEESGHDDGHSDGDGHGHGSSSNSEISGSAELFFNDDKTKLYYKLDFDGMDVTGANQTGGGQTIDTTEDDLYRIHIHQGNSTTSGSTPHAFNIMRPDGDPDDRQIHNGTGVITGIWEPGDDSDTQTSSDITDWYDDLCTENLYFNIHTPGGTNGSAGIIRGQIEVDEHSTVCDAPSLLGLTLINPTTIVAIFSNPIDTSSLSTSDFTAFDLNGTSISSVSGKTDPAGKGVVTITLGSSVSSEFTSDGSMNISSTLTSDIGMVFNTTANPVTIQNGLAGIPVEMTSDEPNLSLVDGSTLDNIMINNVTNPTLDFSSLSTTDSTTNPGQTSVTFPNDINATSTSEGLRSLIEFPDGLTVTGGSTSFNGVFDLPTFSDTCPTISGGTTDNCITIGSSLGSLTFDTPVKMTLFGQASNLPFYQSPGESPVLITSTCDSADVAEVGGVPISSSGSIRECFFNDNLGHMTIWTTHATTFGGGTPGSSTTSSGGGKTTSVLAPNVISYNVCDPTKDGIVRVLTFNNPRIDTIGLNVFTNDFTSYGSNVTSTVPASTYLDQVSSDYVYTIFDAKVPMGVEKFFVTVFDKDDGRMATSTLIDTRNMKCADSTFPHDLKDSNAQILPIEPIDQNAFVAPVESLIIEYNDDSIQFTQNSITTKNSLPESDVKVLVRSSSQSLVEEPIVEPVIEEPIVEPVIEEPIVEPVIEEPIVEPVIEEPIVEPVIEEPIVEPVIEEPIVEPVIEEPIVEPVIEEPTNRSFIDQILSWFGL